MLLLAQTGVVLALSLSTAALAGTPFGFSGVFGDRMVLQRAGPKNPAAQAAVYGGGAAPGAAVKVVLSPTDAVGSSALASAAVETFETSAAHDGSWKILLAPKPAGGTFTVSASAAASNGDSAALTQRHDDQQGPTAILKEVTFGDVWFCSGQSNMELNMHFTFEKNDSYSAVGKGKYKNIRFFHLDHNPSPFKQMQWLVNDSIVTTNWTIADESAVLNDGHGSQCTGHGSGDCTGLDQFSAACWYFAQSLSDRMSDDGSATNAGAAGTIPLGMIESAYGGTTIEQWLSVEAQLRCTNVTCHANSSIPYSASTAEACTQDKELGNGGLWGGMTAPFINMTLTGWLWYQGENNLFADAGTTVPTKSAPEGSGYACLLRQQMDSWREAWSSTPHTTAPDAPFGIVQLADATDEGWGCNIRQMHQAETGNYGVVPNPAFNNAFVAAAHDLGEPWDDGCKGAPHFCCTCFNKTRDPACIAGVDSPFDPTTKFPWLIDRGVPCTTGAQTTPQLMGGVHPSTKIHVGGRLAQAAWSLHYGHTDVPFTGPVVSACGLEKDSQTGAAQLRVQFNTSLLAGDKIRLANYSKVEQASATFVRIEKPFPDNAWQNLVYVNRAPWWGDDSSWIQVDIHASADGSGFVLELDKAELAGKTITGVKYGQGIPGMIPQSGHKRVCCGTRDITVNPCPPASCPITSVKGELPAMPFMAAIAKNGDCKGIAPQVITGLK